MSAAPNRLIWIASYPKSGNTWVRFMICNLLYGRQESAAAIATLVPDMHERAADDALPESGLLKTHFPFGATLPHAAQTTAAIHVVRDPADVLASNFFYSRRSEGRGEASTADFDRYVDSFIEHRGDPRWQTLGMGTWEDNARSWLAATAAFQVLRIRYEDMLEDPFDTCRALARLMKPDSSDAELHRAVADSSFQRMQAIERADIRDRRVGIFYKPYLQASIDSGNRFMRRGVVGDGDARLNPEQRARLRAAFRPLLQELGYRA